MCTSMDGLLLARASHTFNHTQHNVVNSSCTAVPTRGLYTPAYAQRTLHLLLYGIPIHAAVAQLFLNASAQPVGPPTSVPCERLSGHAKPGTLKLGVPAESAGLTASLVLSASLTLGSTSDSDLDLNQSALLFLRKKMPARQGRRQSAGKGKDRVKNGA